MKGKTKKKNEFSKMSKAELQSEMIETMFSSILPLVEGVIRQRLKQFAEVICENLESKKGQIHDQH